MTIDACAEVALEDVIKISNVGLPETGSNQYRVIGFREIPGAPIYKSVMIDRIAKPIADR